MIEYTDSHNTILKCRKNNINIYITKVYGWMFLGLIFTSFIAWNIVHMHLIVKYFLYNQFVLFMLCLLQIILVFIISNFLHRLSGQTLTTLFVSYSFLTGITISGIYSLYNHKTIFTAFITSAVMFLIMYIWGYKTKTRLSNYSNILMMGCMGLFLSSFINVIFHNDLIISITNYLGVFLFTILIAVDAQKLKELGYIVSTNMQDKDNVRRYVILGALILYLDFINLFVTVLQIIGNRHDKEDN
ncbi:Bax inhibitor-1/YccA family protein [Enterobacteriaceae endosymbiont of Macroplea appendiculata]|uniref:Bax inhibitor-1/YccA family protein n=1 Tax=Enterobacteriaceae endosymbiont of Macroplea appendiculata TaxID=2675790 RepID=UPI001448E91F|nr:Bax inhibitor-1/YccA family protein [Enterobacteriaceae endosymbiont of Macroplea appendiculata]QJC30761.1 BAX inhibitor (BI)-1/YccA family protein [Enterobacteriaceae endosymbiont of Macroplea appendiculata]